MHPIVISLALSLLAASASAGTAAPPLEGSKWRFVLIDGAKPVAEGAKLEFAQNTLSAWVGCNGMGGELQLKAGKLIAGQIVSTLMYCEGTMKQERAVSELLSAGPDYRIENGLLLLRSRKHSAELVRAN